ncbi:MAG: VTT domain-containing protein [Candidatus Omnitrophota bacterium]
MGKGLRQFIFFIALIALFIVAGKFFNFDQEQSRQFFARQPFALSSVVFVALYVVGTFFIWFGPKDILRVVSLFVFGVTWSTFLVYIGESLNMVVLFWFSRRLGRPFIEQHARGKIKQLKEAASDTSGLVIFFMKFYPVVPFRFLDLGYGLTGISFAKYAIISLIASPVRLYVIQFFLDLMIRFGLALSGDVSSFMQKYMDFVDYFIASPGLMRPLMAYTFSAFIFFATLLIRSHLRRTKRSEI